MGNRGGNRSNEGQEVSKDEDGGSESGVKALIHICRATLSLL